MVAMWVQPEKSKCFYMKRSTNDLVFSLLFRLYIYMCVCVCVRVCVCVCLCDTNFRHSSPLQAIRLFNIFIIGGGLLIVLVDSG